MLSIKECRKYLNELSDKLTDKQVEEIRDNLVQVINVLWSIKYGK